MKFNLSGDVRRILLCIYKFSQAEKTSLFIVGGFLRDIILGRVRTNPDIDFTLKESALKFSAALAKHMKAGFVVLDEDNGCARIVKKMKGKIYTLDFADFRGRDLWHDLGERDFTVNTLAVELNEFLKNPEWAAVDRYNGVADLKGRVIKAVNPRVFDDDPLRILRAFSLACIFGFRIEPQTLRLLVKKKNKLKQASFERIRDELFKILASPKLYESLLELDKYRIIDIIVPEIKAMRELDQGPYHHLDVWQHTLETVRRLDKIIAGFVRNNGIESYLKEEVSSGRRRLELVKLGAFMHDIGKPSTLRIEDGKVRFHGHEHKGAYILEKVAQRLKLSNNEISLLKRMVRLHLRPGYLADNKVLTARARFRFFRDAGNEAVSVLLVSLADQRATKGCLTTEESRRKHEAVIRRLLKDYFQKKKEKNTVRLVNGNDLMKHYKVSPSPLIGKVLSELEEIQAIGKVKTKKEALEFAGKIIKKYNKTS